MKTYTDEEIEAIIDRIGDRGIDVDVTPLRRLRAAVDAREQAEDEVRAAVEAARSAGWTWGMIALQLGVTVQAAHKRFAAPRPAA